jgi:ribosomal subunit interface protein
MGVAMQIIIHSKKQNLAEDFQAIVNERLSRLERFKVAIDRLDVTVTHEANPRQGKASHRVLITSHGSGPLVRAESAGFNDVAAFDAAAERVELQLRKLHEKSKSINHDSLRYRTN